MELFDRAKVIAKKSVILDLFENNALKFKNLANFEI